MRRKFILGLLSMAIAAVVAGDYFFNRSSGAQDVPKQIEAPKKPNDLFDLLKTELEGKQPSPAEAPIAPPPVQKSDPIAPPNPLPPVRESFGTKEPFPAAPPSGAPPLNVPPPVGLSEAPKPGIPAPAPQEANPVVAPMPPVEVNPTIPPPSPMKLEEKKLDSQPPMEVVAPQPKVAEKQPSVPPQVAPSVDPAVKPVVNNDVPAVQPTTPAVAPPKASVAAGPVKLKNSPWSLHIDFVNEQTIVTASVNKKHEFKIVCRHVDLQTAQNFLKATGKVQITGDAVQASCETLSIALYEDRLVLEGGAEVRIQKSASTYTSESDSKPAVFELKGETLNLRISELQSSKFVETSWQRVVEEGAKTVSAVSTSNAKEWSPYGKLRRIAGVHEGQRIWALETEDGQQVLQFLTRGTLETYVGRTISVYGTTMVQVGDRSMLRVSHIALP